VQGLGVEVQGSLHPVRGFSNRPDRLVWNNVWKNAYDGNRRLISSTDPLNRTSTVVYNTDGTVQAQIDPRGLRTMYQYDAYGDMTTMTASDGGVWKYAYDELGRMVSRSLPVGTRTWTMAYDAADHLISSMDPDGNVSSQIYDSCLLAAVVNPLNERTSYTYGRFGNRLTEMNPLGFVTSYL